MKSKTPYRKKKTLALDGPVVAASIVSNVLSLATPLAVLLIFDRIIPNNSTETLQLLMIGLLCVGLLEFLLHRCRQLIQSFSASRTAVQNHRHFFSRILCINTETFRQTDPAVHLERHAAISTLRGHHNGEGQVWAVDMPFTLLFVAMIGLIGGWLVFVPLSVFVCVLLLALVMKRAQRNVFQIRQHLDRRRYAFLSEILDKIGVVKANTMERQFARRFEMLQKKSAEASHALINFAGLAQTCGAILSQASVAAIGLCGAYLVINNSIGIAELAACMLLNGRVVQPSLRVLSLWVQAEATRNAFTKLQDLEAAPSTRASRTNQALTGKIKFKRLALTPDAQTVTAEVQPGEFVLLETDDDRTIPTLFSVILGQITADGGWLYIDGYLPADRGDERGHRAIVALEQDPVIFTGTIIENISAFGDTAQAERAKAIAARLGLEQRIHRLPKGYNTMLNTGGLFEQDAANRQLISLTRALALQPAILLMDEPSAILETRERDALKACLAELEPRPTLLVSSPDPRIRALTDCTLHLNRKKTDQIAAWDTDTQAEKSLKILKGAA